MDRSAAGRVGIGRPFGPLNPRGAGRSGAPHAPSGPASRARRWQPRIAPVAGGVRSGWLWLRPRQRLRIALLVAVIALPALVGGWMWFRGSSLVAVEHVQVIGVHGPQAGAIQLALEDAARRMTTLEVHPQALRAAVTPYLMVRGLQATPSFPHGLRIRVVEQPPVAALSVAGGRTAVAADGVVLGPALLSGSLPVLEDASGLGQAGQLTGTHLREPSLLACLTVLGAAPPALARAALRAFSGPEGVTVVLRGGVRAVFGDASRPHAKWLSLASVLADPSAAGATYVDVRVPERPAAGVPGAEAAAGQGQAASGTQQGAGAEPSTTGELAGALAAALGAPSAGSAPTAPAPSETTGG